MSELLRRVRDTLRGVFELQHLPRTRAQAEYLNREVSRLAAAARRSAWQARRRSALATQTKASFDFQWDRMPAGAALPSDTGFMSQLERELPAMVGVSPEWFAGKRVVDIGCGIGRYTYGLLQLGAVVTACDQSEAALRRTAELCQAHDGRLTLRRIDLLDWDAVDDYDLAFCFGVVHHTGNTYLAIEHVGRKVAVGGRVFFMVYAVPETAAALQEINLYERLADEVRRLSFAERKLLVEQRFGPEKAHGWFDAISPGINERLSFGEIHDVLSEIGFDRISGRLALRNHYVTAERVRPA